MEVGAEQKGVTLWEKDKVDQRFMKRIRLSSLLGRANLRAAKP